MDSLQRRQPRHPLIYYLKVFDCASGEQIGFLGDITDEGVMVMSEQPLPVDHDYVLEIRNQSGRNQTRNVRCAGHSVWSHGELDPDYFATGFRLCNLDGETERAIQALIREIGFTG